MRIERLGASSEEEVGCPFDRLADTVFSVCSFSPLSVSVSEAIPEDKDSVAFDLRRLTFILDFRWPLPLSEVDAAVASGDAESPTACAVDRRPLRFGRALPSFRSGVNGEKRPSSL